MIWGEAVAPDITCKRNDSCDEQVYSVIIIITIIIIIIILF
jgi:hypothetical protein